MVCMFINLFEYHIVGCKDEREGEAKKKIEDGIREKFNTSQRHF